MNQECSTPGPDTPVFLVATTTPPDISCPDWCEMSDVHLDDLASQAGFVVHSGTVWKSEVGGSTPPAALVRAGYSATPSGDLEPGSERVVNIYALEELTYGEAEDLARALLAFVTAERERLA